MSHTKEPWKIDPVEAAHIVTHDLKSIADMCGSYPVTNENARRIVACVNACAGVPTEVVEKYTHETALRVALVTQRDEIRQLEQRNAELVEALTQISNYEGKDFVEFVCNIVEIKLAAHKEAK